MPIEIYARCVRCKLIKLRGDFPYAIQVNRAGKKVRVYDRFCYGCQRELRPEERRADERDMRPPDR